MKKARGIAPLFPFVSQLGELRFIRASSPDEHDKIIDFKWNVIAVRSNQSGRWYISSRYRLILSRHMLERIAREQSFRQYWFGLLFPARSGGILSWLQRMGMSPNRRG